MMGESKFISQSAGTMSPNLKDSMETTEEEEREERWKMGIFDFWHLGKKVVMMMSGSGLLMTVPMICD